MTAIFRNQVLRYGMLLTLVFVLAPFPQLARGESDQNLDPTFGVGGVVVLDLDHPGSVFEVLLQPDGKMLALGREISMHFIVRLHPDGTLDQSFGNGGKVSFEGQTSSIPFLTLIPPVLTGLLQPDGKTLIGDSRLSRFRLRRFNEDGSLDIGFGQDGTVLTPTMGVADHLNSIALQPDGKIVAAGMAQQSRMARRRLDFAVVRYNSDGSVDTTFGNGGTVTTDIVGLDDFISRVLVQQDGKILAVGNAELSPVSIEGFSLALARYDSKGNLDTEFGDGGIQITPFGVRDLLLGDALILPSGRIKLAGGARPDSFFDEFPTIARLQPDGSPDHSFGSNGKVFTDFGHFGFFSRVILTANGKVVAGGGLEDVSGRFHAALARFHLDGTLDTNFGTEGRLVNSHFFPIRSLAVQPDRRIVVATSLRLADTLVNGVLARFLAGPEFDNCIRDSSRGIGLELNSHNGDYFFRGPEDLTLSGRGIVRVRGCLLTLEHSTSDRRVSASLDRCSRRGTVSIQILSPARRFSITDRSTLAGECVF